MRYLYEVHGLVLESAAPFPELRRGEGKPDLYVRPGDLSHPSGEDFVGGRYSVVDGDVMTVAWQDHATFHLRGGHQLKYAVAGKALAEPVWLRQALLGAGLGLLLHQRGCLVLHASAVCAGGSAVLLLGHKGHGKSTTAAALCMRGHRLVADDVVSVTFDPDGRAYVQPGLSQVKLWSDAAAAIDLSRSPSRLHSDLDKFVVPLRGVPNALPIRAAYVLTVGEENHAVRIARQRDAFLALLPHLYAPRLIGAASVTPELHESLGAFVRATATYHLHRRSGLDHLPGVLNLVEQMAAVGAS